MDDASEAEANKKMFFAKYERMANARKNRSTFFNHQCCKKTCNPITEKQMVMLGLLRSTTVSSAQGGAGFKGSYANIDSTMFVCEYGTMHLCNKNVPSSWYADTIPYSPCDLVSTHTQEICCQISGLSLGYKQALPFIPASGKDGVLSGGSASNSSSNFNQQENLYDDLSGFNHTLKMKQRQQQKANSYQRQQVQQEIEHEKTNADGDGESFSFNTKNKLGVANVGLRGPRLRTLTASSQASSSRQTAITTVPSKPALDAFRDIKITTIRNQEKLRDLTMKDKMEKDKERKELEEAKKNSIVIKRGAAKSNSNPRCKRSLSNTTGRMKQKRQKQKPKVSKLMHEKLNAKIAKKQKQIQREKIREGVISISKSLNAIDFDDKKENPGSNSTPVNAKPSKKRKRHHRTGNEREKENGDKTKRRKLNGHHAVDSFPTKKDEEEEEEEEGEEKEKEINDRDETMGEPLNYLRFPSSLDSIKTETMDETNGNNNIESANKADDRRKRGVFDQKLTQEEKQLKMIATNLIKDLFYSSKRTDIYNRSTRIPRDRGERAVKSKWAKATKEYKEHQKTTSIVNKKTTTTTTTTATASMKQRKTVQSNKGGLSFGTEMVPISADAVDIGAIGLASQRATSYVGFNSMLGFTVYRNMVLKFTKIKKTPRLPTNEEFINFFVKHAMLQWSIIKKSPYGQSIIRSNSENKRTPQGDVTLTSFSTGHKTIKNRGKRKSTLSSSSSTTVATTPQRRRKTTPSSFSNEEIEEEYDLVIDPPTENERDKKTLAVATPKAKGGKKQNHGTLSFLGLCLALLYIMRVDNKMVMGRVVIPYCKYVAENIPQIKDLEDYDPKYQCKLITRSTEILKAAYMDMVEKHALMKDDLDKIESIAYL